MKDRLNRELIKLVPENYKIMVLPAFFNYTDPEKVRTSIATSITEFLIKTPKKVLFTVGVKIFSFHN